MAYNVKSYTDVEQARQISEVHFDEYNSYYVVNGKDVNLEEYDRLHHLWTIKDVRDGDVLQLGGVTAIFKEYIGYGNCKCYCSVFDGEFEIPSQDGDDNSYGCIDATPATKEQRDKLEKAMADAGYTFDFDKKELKKIVVPIFNIGDTIAKKHNSDIYDFGSFIITDITGGKYWDNDRIICDITKQDEWEIYEPVRQEPVEWSEEDEVNYQCILSRIDSNPFLEDANVEKYRNWLKSLKDRYAKLR